MLRDELAKATKRLKQLERSQPMKSEAVMEKKIKDLNEELVESQELILEFKKAENDMKKDIMDLSDKVYNLEQENKRFYSIDRFYF